MRHRRATVSPRRSLVRSLASACVLALFGVVMIAPGSMSAHARLVSSSPVSGTALPAMPIEFTLDFGEEIDPGFSSASLLRSDEESVPLGPLATTDNRRTLIVPIVEPDTVPPGTYTLVWRALSAADGHVTTGTVAFSVGTGVAPETAGGSELRPPWWRVALRWLELAGLALAAGAFLFAFLIVRKPIAGLPLQVRAFGRVVLLATAVVILLSTYDLGISATGAGFFDPPGIAAF